MARSLWLAFAASFLFSASPAPPALIDVRVVPFVPFIETRDGAQIVNADLLVHNEGPTPLKLAAIRARIYDRTGKLEMVREINANGRPPALATMGNLVIAPGGAVDFYQPFDRFDRDVDLARVRLDLVFLAADRAIPPVAFSGDASAAIEIRPQRYHPAPYCLPLAGKLLVHDGHDLASHHRRHDLAGAFEKDPRTAMNPNLFADDFVRIDATGRLYKGDPDRKENWFTFGASVFAPMAGTVVEAVDGISDNRLSGGAPITPPEAERLDPGGFGNHVAIRGADGRVAWLLHLEAGTLTVHSGQRVRPGALLGRIGFSGDALFPHLHFTVTANAHYPSQGVPSYFTAFNRVLGRRRIAERDGQIDSGDLIEALSGADAGVCTHQAQ